VTSVTLGFEEKAEWKLLCTIYVSLNKKTSKNIKYNTYQWWTCKRSSFLRKIGEQKFVLPWQWHSTKGDKKNNSLQNLIFKKRKKFRRKAQTPSNWSSISCLYVNYWLGSLIPNILFSLWAAHVFKKIALFWLWNLIKWSVIRKRRVAFISLSFFAEEKKRSQN
jgi:hypothetical protein